MNKPLARFLSVFTMLSRIPVRAGFEPDYSRSDFWIPAISPLVSLVAIAGGTLSWLLFKDVLLAVLGALAFQYLAFNLFHVDGLLDTADAMATFATPERRLEILKDSRIGAYAFFYGALVLATKTAVLSALFRRGFPVAVAALLAAPLAGRAACALIPLLSSPARPGGLGSLMRGFSAVRCCIGILAGVSPLAAAAFFPGRTLLAAQAAGAALAGAALAGFLTARLYRLRVGGFTGDALGAAVETGELAALLALAACLRFFP